MTDTEQPTQTVEEMVKVYIKIRTAIEDLEAEHEAKLAKLEEEKDIVSQHLLNICNEQNVDSLRTPAGTVSRRVTSRYWTSDWEHMYEFIREHDAMFLLERRIHNGNMKQFLEENPEVMPIGLQADRKFVIQIRKPTNR